MAGYDGYSMSNNARRAYTDGLLPASKMIKELKKRFPKTFKGLNTKVFKKFVTASEWHHTSCKYNETKFYSLIDVFEVRHEIKSELAKGKYEFRVIADGIVVASDLSEAQAIEQAKELNGYIEYRERGSIYPFAKFEA